MLCQRISTYLRVSQCIQLKCLTVMSSNNCNFAKSFASLDRRTYSSDKTPPLPAIIPVVLYEEIKDLPNHPEKLLFDVREPNELAETGRIPTSINVPLGQVQKAFSDETDAITFLHTYGADKPDKGHNIIFSCRSGVRAEDAAQIVSHLGYTNVKNYRGSWLDWAEREKLPEFMG